MKHISRYIMTLVALFAMTAGAWAEETTVYKSAVAISNLKQGDILAQGFSLTGSEIVYIVANRYKEDGTVGIYNKITFFDANTTYGENSSFIKNGVCYTPVDADGNDGNAWEVKEIVQGSPYIQGITYSVPGEMTLNAAKTVATMEMPAYDAVVDYELVRDMAVEMPVTVGDGNDGYRIRIKKESNSFVPAEMTLQQMMALFNVHDDIENQDLVFYGQGKNCDISIYAVDDEDQITGDAIAFQSLTPGRYVAIATAVDGTIYDGETEPSNIFQLYQGYEVDIPAGEYITYYKEENLYVENEEVKLYTITAVGETTATLSSALTVAPANTPLLVFNGGQQPATILLIPTENAADDVTAADEFLGTLTATTIAASDASTDRYAFNGKQFVWVKNDLAVGANKAWLAIPTGTSNARSITLVFGEATKITTTNFTDYTDGVFYDLNGRKLNAVPTKKGVYILNGKKVVVK